MKPVMQFRTFTCTMLIVTLAACAPVGPNFQPSTAQVPGAWNPVHDAGAPKVADTDPMADPDVRWWHAFHDPLLDSLEERAVAGNLDLQVALLRIAASRSQEQVARAQGLPNVKATAQYQREQLGLEGILKSKGALPAQIANNPEAGAIESQLTQPVNLFTVALDASWELDLFGKVRRSVEAAGAQTDANVEARNGALVSLEAEVAQTYLQLRGAQALRALTLSALSDERQILELTRNRQTAGLSAQSDVESIAGQLAQNEADLPQYEVQIAQAVNGLSVLLGTSPGTLTAELDGPGQVYALPNVVPVGLPATLARRRPDIRQAEANLHAATAQTGVAMAALFPDISLSAQGGLRNTSTKYLFNWASHFYSVGPSVSLPIFTGGSLTANVHMARAEQQAAALDYRKTVLNALSEVQNALTAFYQDQLRAQSLAESANASARSLSLSQDAYGHGLVSFITVLDGDRQNVQARLALSNALVSESTDLITLYKALGGGWQNDGVPLAAR